jgi:hypothetical protein
MSKQFKNRNKFKNFSIPISAYKKDFKTGWFADSCYKNTYSSYVRKMVDAWNKLGACGSCADLTWFTLPCILYYECWRWKFNIYNWLLKDLFYGHSVNCMRRKKNANFSRSTNQGFICLEENVNKICSVLVTFWYF